MNKPVLLIIRRLPAAVEARASRDYDVRLNEHDTPRSGEEIVRLAQGAGAILCSPADKLDGKTITALPASVKAIATFSVGFDHIDITAAKARGIQVGNTPDVLSVATAEIAMMLMLMAARRAGEGERWLRAGKWTGWTPTQFIGTQISGRRLGILGMGRIGREMARMARGFEMEIHYHNRSRLDPVLEDGAIYHADDASFLPVCDVLSLNAPGGDATRKWLNAGRIARLPPGAIVVNTGRGTVVDDEALIGALQSGRVSAAGLDVYDGEPHVHAGYLALENVVLAPHLGSGTREARDAMGFRALDNIDAALSGSDMPFRIA